MSVAWMYKSSGSGRAVFVKLPEKTLNTAQYENSVINNTNEVLKPICE